MQRIPIHHGLSSRRLISGPVRFESTFCKPKHTIPASDSNQAAFNIKKDTNETIQVALYYGKPDTIAETIESSKVRAAF